jgi:hypothetical protein
MPHQSSLVIPKFHPSAPLVLCSFSFYFETM